MMEMNKKGAIGIGDAPTVVMIVGFVFLMMATVAYIGEEYKDALPDSSATVINESVTTITESGEYLGGIGACGYSNFAVILVTNETGNATGDGSTIDSGNYTIGTTTGLLTFTGGDDVVYNNTNWNVTYSYDYKGIACNVTESLGSELADNTSIAGIILTISLVGIVLSVLIGIFVASRRGGL